MDKEVSHLGGKASHGSPSQSGQLHQRISQYRKLKRTKKKKKRSEFEWLIHYNQHSPRRDSFKIIPHEQLWHSQKLCSCERTFNTRYYSAPVIFQEISAPIQFCFHPNPGPVPHISIDIYLFSTRTLQRSIEVREVCGQSTGSASNPAGIKGPAQRTSSNITTLSAMGFELTTGRTFYFSRSFYLKATYDAQAKSDRPCWALLRVKTENSVNWAWDLNDNLLNTGKES